MKRPKPSGPAAPVEVLAGVAGTFPGPFTDQSPPFLGPLVIERVETEGGYGTDPNMITPHSPWPRTLTLYERHVIGALADLVLPERDKLPSEVGIADFFDDWLSAPYPQQVSDKRQILSGLQTLDRMAQGAFDNEFAQLTNKQKSSVLNGMIKSGDDGVGFFVRFRYLVIGGYYTSDIGMRRLGYRGNIPLRRPAEIQSDVLTVVEAELRKLGL
ncbi:hypothetical protein N185_16365 [Sinorhizobium sp. GW3]|nr:hypothetical protein N185_16365 [Sinorhizobium sp. GW3]